MDNVLIDDDGHVVLTNFGSAINFGAYRDGLVREDLPARYQNIATVNVDDITTHIAGKPGYMAPEILRGMRRSQTQPEQSYLIS